MTGPSADFCGREELWTATGTCQPDLSGHLVQIPGDRSVAAPGIMIRSGPCLRSSGSAPGRCSGSEEASWPPLRFYPVRQSAARWQTFLFSRTLGRSRQTSCCSALHAKPGRSDMQLPCHVPGTLTLIRLARTHAADDAGPRATTVKYKGVFRRLRSKQPGAGMSGGKSARVPAPFTMIPGLVDANR